MILAAHAVTASNVSRLRSEHVRGEHLGAALHEERRNTALRGLRERGPAPLRLLQ